MSVTNKKNRHFTPGVKIENIPLFFNTGINPLGGLLDALLLSKRIEAEGARGKYKILPEYAGGDEEAYFTQSKTAPTEAEVLYKHPNLVDAESEQQVRDYLKEWSGAIELTTSEKIEEIDATNPDVSHLVSDMA